MENAEARIEKLEAGQAAQKRRLDEVFKCTVLVCEGIDRLEDLYKQRIEVQEGQRAQWNQFKSDAPEALLRDLSEHLGTRWPPEGNSAKDKALKDLGDALMWPGTIRHAHAQYKYDTATETSRRIPGTFTIRLTFGAEALCIQSAMKVLEKETRRASGLKVDGEDTHMGDGQPPKRRLVYIERTETEREQRKGKGKGKAKGKEKDGAAQSKGKEKGKGSKHNKKGKGKEKGQKGTPGKGGK